MRYNYMQQSYSVEKNTLSQVMCVVLLKGTVLHPVCIDLYALSKL